MKKPSKKWKEFGQLIEIVGIRIGKAQRKLVKLKKRHQEILEVIEEKWQIIEQEQFKLKALKVEKEDNALSRMFMRRESIKSSIESLFFDVSLEKQSAEKLTVEIKEAEVEKLRLEKRKEAMSEIREQMI